MLPLHLKGTEFQLSVWKELLNIPLGGITSYGKIAQKLQKPNACRAVGSVWAIILYRYLYPVTGCSYGWWIRRLSLGIGTQSETSGMGENS